MFGLILLVALRRCHDKTGVTHAKNVLYFPNHLLRLLKGVKMNINPLTAIDFYKADHRRQYPHHTTEVYSNYTARSAKNAVVAEGFDDQIVFFGLQYFIKHFLIEAWQTQFFQQPKDKVVAKYKRRMDYGLGKDAIETTHIEALHDLGYLPLRIKALPEGERVSIGVPILTIVNTHPDFFWLTNYIESVMSNYLWQPLTSATTAFEYKRVLTKFARLTGTSEDFVLFQAHDFSFRGLSSFQSAAISGAAHLTSFYGTDTVAAVDLLEDYYAGNAEEMPLGLSVAATEHSVMCMAGKDHEFETYRRLICDLYPKGIVSIVSDTWDLWKVITEYLVDLKEAILSRDGKIVIRPDSGDPTDILCGDKTAPVGSPAYKGAVECLWEIFGGTMTNTGHKLLDTHIGLIYGDLITLPRAQEILQKLAEKGFASGNVVFGIGTMTYQNANRDNFSFALKATSGVVNGQRHSIFKDPITSKGTKRSAKGLLRVEKENGRYVLYEEQTEAQEQQGELKVVFENGQLIRPVTFKKIRERLAAYLIEQPAATS